MTGSIGDDVPDVRALRERLGMSPAQLAQRLGVTLTTVVRWEDGASRPTRHLLRALRDLRARADAAPERDRRDRGGVHPSARRAGRCPVGPA